MKLAKQTKFIIVAIGFFGVASCSTAKIADNTTDAVVFVGKNAVKGVFGASRLVVRGAASGVQRLQRPTDGFPTGTIVCLNDAGEKYAAAVETDGKFICPDPA